MIRFTLLLCLTLVRLAGARELPPAYYLIGNSLTWDSVPARIDGDVQWHVDCGKPIAYIHAHPEKPCVKTSTLWPKALKAKQYTYLSVQPHYDASVTSAAEAIGHWIRLQPNAIVVIHTGWAHHENRAAEYAANTATGKLVHSEAHYAALIAQLKKEFPKRTFRSTHAMRLLHQIATDIEAGKAPLEDVAELHRDAIHVTHSGGRYLMHNCMRHALNQPRSSMGFEKIDPKLKAYLDGVLDTLKP